MQARAMSTRLALNGSLDWVRMHGQEELSERTDALMSRTETGNMFRVQHSRCVRLSPRRWSDFDFALSMQSLVIVLKNCSLPSGRQAVNRSTATGRPVLMGGM